MRIKPAGKLVLLIVAVGVCFGLWRVWQMFGSKLAPAAPEKGSVEVGKVNLPDAPVSGSDGTSTPVTLPGSEPGCTDKPEVRFLHWAWNAQMGIMFATGGQQATNGSLMCKNGVNLRFIREDDVSQMQAKLVAFATELSQGTAQPTKGAHFVAIMGDGAATFLKGVNEPLKKLGPEYTAKVVGAIGYSRGEDKFMGPAEWKTNPAASKGGLVAGVLRDGDWNIAQKWLGDNGLKNNPDEKTWDPDALNWVNASTYIDAPEKYVANYSETRPVVRNGKKTGETKQVTVNAVVTWTPGDVIAAQKKGGLVSIVSTKEYTTQMPCVIIGIDKWMRQNRATVEGMLKAAAEGGQAVKGNASALKFASEVSNLAYKEQGTDPAYWEKYYHGTQEMDKNGQKVDLGGSSVNNLADSLLTFGLVEGGANLFAATYQVFGNIVVRQYPELVPNYPPVSEILDTSYLAALKKKAGTTVQIATKPQDVPKNPTTVVSSRTWDIQFETGRAAFTAPTKKQMDELLRQLLPAGGTVIEIHGHTDNVGDANANMKLSEDRAFAVQQWLLNRARRNFDGRLKIFAHGQTEPVAPNSTPQGRAKNRRVVIILKA